MPSIDVPELRPRTRKSRGAGLVPFMVASRVGCEVQARGERRLVSSLVMWLHNEMTFRELVVEERPPTSNVPVVKPGGRVERRT